MLVILISDETNSYQPNYIAPEQKVIVFADRVRALQFMREIGRDMHA